MNCLLGFYDRAKAKFHHMYHIHETIERFNRVLSCFVTERAHRRSKRAALHVFRYLEQTVMKDLVNRTVEQFAGDSSLFLRAYLIRPKVAELVGAQVHKSTKATLHVGILMQRMWSD